MIRCVTSRDEFVSLRPAWDALHGAAAPDNPFLTHEWLDNWIAHFGAGRFLALVNDSPGAPTPRAATVLVRAGDRYGFLEDDHSYYPGVLHHRDDLAPLTPLLGFLRHELGAARVELTHSPANGSFCAALQRTLGNDRCPPARAPGTPCRGVAPSCEALRRSAVGDWCVVPRDLHALRRVSLEGGFAGYLAERPKKLRHELRRKARRIGRVLPNVKLVCLSAEGERGRAFAAIQEVERGSWKQEAKTAIFNDPVERDFYEEVYARAARREAARVFVLTAADRPLAYVLGFFHGAAFFALKTSYTAERAELSPGVVLFYRTIEALCDEGRATALELLGSDARWKQELATEARTLCSYDIRPATLRARLATAAHHHLRPPCQRGLSALERRWPAAAQRLRAAITGCLRRD